MGRCRLLADANMKNTDYGTTVALNFPRRNACRVLLFLAVLSLNGCVVAAAAGAAVGATIEVVKIPFKVVGAAVDLAIPGGD